MRVYGMFQTSCPSGWTLEAAWVGTFLMGDVSYDDTELGSSNHRHLVTFSNDKIGGSAQALSKYGPHTAGGVRIHRQADNHSVNQIPTNSEYTDNMPPYLNVVYCYQEI